jgi:hypothetical protein
MATSPCVSEGFTGQFTDKIYAKEVECLEFNKLENILLLQAASAK